MNSGWTAAAAILLAAGSVTAADRHCQLKSYGEIDAVIQDGEIVADASINGKPVQMIVDTGTWGTMLFESSAKRLGLALRQTGVQAYGIGGENQVYSARVNKFTLGGVSEQDADLMVAGHELAGTVGLIGAKYLLQTDVEFDLPHGKIRFFKPVDCHGDEVVYWGQAYAVALMIPRPDDYVMVRVDVNGQPIVAQIDSGATFSVLTFQGAQEAGVGKNDPNLKAVGEAQSMGTETLKTFAERFDSFSFGDETIHNAELRVADLFAKAKVRVTGNLIASDVMNQPQMMLGADFLRAHRVFISRDQLKVYISYEGGPVFRPPGNDNLFGPG
jgi:clan AA aspartic protease (TIGR02281 family)